MLHIDSLHLATARVIEPCLKFSDTIGSNAIEIYVQ